MAAAVAHMRLSVRPCVWRDPAHLDLCLAPREIARAIGVQESSRHPSPHLLAHHLAGSNMCGTILNVDCGIQDLSFYLLLGLGIPSIFLRPYTARHGRGPFG